MRNRGEEKVMTKGHSHKYIEAFGNNNDVSFNKINNQDDYSINSLKNNNMNKNNVFNQNLPNNNKIPIKIMDNNMPYRYSSAIDLNFSSPLGNPIPEKENKQSQLINLTKNKSKPVLGRDNAHYNNIYFSNNNKKDIPTSGILDKNNGSKTSFYSNNSHSNNYTSTTSKKINQKSDPLEFGDRLYKKAFLIQGKLDKIRKDEEIKRKKSTTPELSPVAKKIKRDPNKFHERLYPGMTTSNKTMAQNKNANEVQIINTVMDIGFLKDIEKNYQSEKINHNPNIENLSKDLDSDTHIKNDENIDLNHLNDNFNLNNKSNENDEEHLNKIYRKNKEKSEYYIFDHKPKLNKKSLKIAEQLQPSKERLVSKKKKSKSRSPDRTPAKFKNNSNFSYISDEGYNTVTSIKRSKSPTPTTRVKQLYEKGLEQKKKLESLYDRKKKMDQEEYKKFTFKPKIIKNSPVLICKISGDHDKLNKSSENNFTKENEKSKHDMYEKQLNWKKNIENNNKRLKKTFDDEKSKNLSFKPVIQKRIPENDEKFIMKNIEQIEEYVNRRRNNIQKQKEEEEYKKKIFPNGENFKSKPTVAKEFKFKTEERSRSRSADRSKSREPSTNSPRNVKMMRKKINAGDFFELPNKDDDNEKYLESNLTQKSQSKNGKNTLNNYYSFNDAVNQSKANMTPTESSGFVVEEEDKVAFVNAINNLHSKLVNFKF